LEVKDELQTKISQDFKHEESDLMTAQQQLCLKK